MGPGELGQQRSVFLVLFQLLDAPVDGGDVFLFDFEETLRLQQVIYGRNEVGVLVLLSIHVAG